MRPINVLRRTKPLFFTNSNELIISKSANIYSRDADGNTSFLFSFSESIFTKVLGFFPLLFRMMRLGVMSGIASGDDYFFTHGKKIHRYNSKCKQLFEEYEFKNGRGPLQFCKVENIQGFKDSVYFGEYYGNHSRSEVKIFTRTVNGTWKAIFKFKSGEINHVHGLVPDSFNQCVWVLAGDFEHSAAIYKATNNFDNVEIVVSGMQRYRSCVAFPTVDGLLYATDTQIESNSIRLLSEKNGCWVSSKVSNLNGSCIYGCELDDYYVFSTSTEPCDKPKNKLHSLFDNKPGAGIIENKSDIVIYNKKTKKIDILTSKKKDIYPFRIFQFGTIMFPNGKQQGNTLFAYNVGNIKNDISTEIYQINESI